MESRQPALIILVVVALSACADEIPTRPILEPPRLGAVGPDSAFIDDGSFPGERAYKAVAAEFPGFAGYFYDSGKVIVETTVEGRTERMLESTRRAMGSGMLDARNGVSSQTAAMTLRTVSYSYRQLDRWRRLVRDELYSLREAHWLALDVMANQIIVGVRDVAVAARIAQEAVKLGVPVGAFRTSTAQFSPIASAKPPAVTAFSADLRGRGRPVVGGMLIQMLNTAHNNNRTVDCTLGIGVLYNGVAGFLTNSHCTNSVGTTNQPSGFFQNDIQQPATNLIGIETIDPPFTTAACATSPHDEEEMPPFPIGYPGPWPVFPPAAVLCRHTDLIFAPWDAGAVGAQSLGLIARTTALGDYDFGQLTGSITIDAVHPNLYVTSEYLSTLTPGMYLEKMGERTGWTRGRVLYTDVSVSVQWAPWPRVVNGQIDSVWTVVNLTAASFGVDYGDSGSPVFTTVGTGVLTQLVGFANGKFNDPGNGIPSFGVFFAMPAIQ